MLISLSYHHLLPIHNFLYTQFQKLLRYLNGIVKGMFKGGAGGRGGQFIPFGGTYGCRGCISLFPIYFVLYLNDLPSETLSLTSSISSL